MPSSKKGSILLVVCHGNINRSAAAGIVLRHYGIENVVTAGFHGPGRPMAKKMRDALIDRGFDAAWCGQHRSQLVNKSLIEQCRLAFFMDGGNMGRLQKLAPEHGKKFRCLGDFAKPPVKRIPDPAYIARGTQEFEAVVDMIVGACKALAEHIQQEL